MRRYIPTTDQDRETMLGEIGVSSVDELFADIPADKKLDRPLILPQALSEQELVQLMKSLSDATANASDHDYFIGAGCYNHFIPSLIDHFLTRSEFYTAYTPYQPELSQGTLQAMFEFQTMICQLTGMEVANASMYDAATAVAEAALMSTRVHRKRDVILVSRTVHPEYREVLAGYLARMGLEMVEFGWQKETGRSDLDDMAAKLNDKVATVIVQSPNFFGVIENLELIRQASDSSGAMLSVAVSEPISLGILKPPGEYGADIVVGNGQSLGIPMSYGGPHLGFFACKEKFQRQMPGRLAGQTVDHDGRRGFVMTLATREQHIRRARATSNICTNHQLCALAATIYMATMGKQGMREVARLNLLKADYARKSIEDLGGKVLFSGPTFNEFVLRCGRPVIELNEELLDRGLVGGFRLKGFYPQFDAKTMLCCFTEQLSKGAIDEFCEEVTK